MGFKGARKKCVELTTQSIYNERAAKALKKMLEARLRKNFQKTGKVNLDTTSALGDLRQFHIDWQFQHVKVSDADTVDYRLSLANPIIMNDLTGSLANFGIYAAVGRVQVDGDRYYATDPITRKSSSCIEAQAKVTHIYLYVKDNYSFNDADGNTQYLGHWNKDGVILVKSAALGSQMNGKNIHTDFGNSPEVADPSAGLPVDARRGIVRKARRQDVYWPIYNKTYNEWREKRARGGDFMIYSKPRLLELNKPIEFSIGSICRHLDGL